MNDKVTVYHQIPEKVVEWSLAIMMALIIVLFLTVLGYSSRGSEIEELNQKLEKVQLELKAKQESIDILHNLLIEFNKNDIHRKEK